MTPLCNRHRYLLSPSISRGQLSLTNPTSSSPSNTRYMYFTRPICKDCNRPAHVCTERLSRICEGPNILGKPGYQGYWTSGQRSNPASCGTPWVWKTYAGSYKNVSYTDWYGGEPNCAGDKETCLQLTTTKYLDQRWADINCEWVLCPLCELDV